MNHLLIDIGNSRIKWGWDDGQLSGAISHHQDGWLEQLRHAWQDTTPSECRISNVAHREVLQKVQSLITCPTLLITAQAQHQHLILGYEPNQMGADRYAQLLGAQTICAGKNHIVISAGTATTIDGVLASGQHIGGIILPSVHLMRSSLHQYTAKLPLDGGDFQPNHAPQNTADALATAAQLAILGALHEFIRRYMNGLEIEIVLCGGAADEIAKQLNINPVNIAPSLCLVGLKAWQN